MGFEVALRRSAAISNTGRAVIQRSYDSILRSEVPGNQCHTPT